MKITHIVPVLLVSISISLLAACTGAGPIDLGGRVWVDINANGLQDEGEAGLPGIVAQLFGKTEGQADFAQIDETVTDDQGNYGFSGLDPGEYYVQFRLPGELAFTYEDVGDDDDLDSEPQRFNGQTKPVQFDGEPQLTQDAGLLQIPDLVQVSGWVWEDWNDNGIQDSDEIPLDGVTVNLLHLSAAGSSEVLFSTSSDPEGMYSFYVLPGPGQLQVEVVPPSGYETVLRDLGGNDSLDSDVDPVSRKSDPVSASEEQLVDIGLAPLSGIADWAWLDANGDGIQAADEVGLEDVFVFLYRFDKDSNVFVFHDLLLTDADGFYEFYPLRPGSYYLRFLPPGGFGFTLWNAGDDVAKDSDAMQDTGATPDIILPDDAVLFLDILSSDIWDAGFVQAVSDLPSYSFENDTDPFICDTEEPVDDPEVRVSTVRAVRLPNGDLWVLVKMARALEQDYSFAVILYIRTPAGTIAFLWEIHDLVRRIGQIDQNGELIREIDAQLQAFHHLGLGIVGFYVPGSLLPVGTDLGRLSSFHTPVEEEMKVCAFTPTFNVP